MELDLEKKVKEICVLADGTRSQIFQWIIEHNPVTTKEIAERFSLHRNVARAHLDKMVDIELLRFERKKKSAGGRPAKLYFLGKTPVDLHFPPRQYLLLTNLLVQIIKRLSSQIGDGEGPQTAAVAEAVGYDAGRSVFGGPPTPAREGAKIDFDDVMGRVVVEMNALGFHCELLSLAAKEAEIKVHNCIFNEVAIEDPQLTCRLDMGLLRGLLSRHLPNFSVESHKCVSSEKSHCCVKIARLE